MENKYKFKDLKTSAKLKASIDYREGWLETHEEFLCFLEIREILEDSDDLYNSKGELLDE